MQSFLQNKTFEEVLQFEKYPEDRKSQTPKSKLLD